MVQDDNEARAAGAGVNLEGLSSPFDRPAPPPLVPVGSETLSQPTPSPTPGRPLSLRGRTRPPGLLTPTPRTHGPITLSTPGPHSIGAASSPGSIVDPTRGTPQSGVALVTPTPKGMKRGQLRQQLRKASPPSGSVGSSVAGRQQSGASSSRGQGAASTAGKKYYDPVYSTPGMMLRNLTNPPLYDAPAEPRTDAEPEVPKEAPASPPPLEPVPSPAAKSEDRFEDEKATEPPSLGPCIYAMYWVILFAAFWFGSARFDVDGDGDFDEYDVQKFLEDRSIISRNFKKDDNQKPAYMCSVNSVSKRQRDRNLAIVTGSDTNSPMVSPQARQPSPPQAGGVGLQAEADGGDDLGGVVRAALESDVEGQAEEAYVMQKMLSGQSKPLYILFVSFVPFFLFLLAAIAMATDGDNVNFTSDMFGLDTAFNKETFGKLSEEEELDLVRNGYEGETDLRSSRGSCEDIRWQAWRWWTYQFTHVGWPHLLVNILLNVIFGIPLEGVHGTRRMILMYNIGVLGGACCNFVFDAHSAVVGMSGGCYALIGMHVADLVMNWSQKRYRKPIIVMIITAVATDVVIHHFRSTDVENTTSYATHCGGAVAGLLVGIVFGKNYEVKRWEIVLVVISAVLLPLLFAGSVIWHFSHDPPQNIYDAESWCWQRAIWNYNIFGDEWQCVRCGTKACTERWSTEQWLRPIGKLSCSSPVYASADGSL